ncbi:MULTISPECIES: ribose-phosphate diphosphokinase [Blautia]|uniref:ribose-phosphate diphosphokinase n=1 Tax=Blautia TaxID=572511 RepID=UPI000BA35619
MVNELNLIVLPSCDDFGNLVYKRLREIRKEDVFLIKPGCFRFATGEGKVVFNESIRGSDVYIFVDVTNYNVTYRLRDKDIPMSPDEHFQDLKRVISVAISEAQRVSVIMPYLYEGRQHKKNNRESLDCALMLQELFNLGVANIITFDAHDPRIQNAIPLGGFVNLIPSYQFLKTIINNIKSIKFEKEKLIIISPDEGAVDRAILLANSIQVDMGMFYKRRDYSKIKDGRNPILEHKFLGGNVEGKDCILIDDMISTGESIIDTAHKLKIMGANKVIICCTFGLFTEGINDIEDAYCKQVFDYMITTNLNYREQSILDRKWYLEADMSEYAAMIIDSLNKEMPLDSLHKLESK